MNESYETYCLIALKTLCVKLLKAPFGMPTVCKHRVFILIQTFEHISAFSKLTSDYSFAHGNRYRELTIDYTQRLSALIVNILKMRLTGQNRLVS